MKVKENLEDIRRHLLCAKMKAEEIILVNRDGAFPLPTDMLEELDELKGSINECAVDAIIMENNYNG